MSPLAQKLLAPPLVVATLVVGVWFWSGVVAPDYWTTIGFGAAWFVVCSVIFGRIGKARPDVRWWLRGTFLACSVAALAGFWWTSIRETEVDEQVATGVPASQVAAAELGGVDPLAPQPEDPAAAKAAPSAAKPATGGASSASAAAKTAPRAAKPAPSAATAAATPAPRRNVVVLAGAVVPRSHSASGRARIVKLASGARKLTLSDGFRIDPGPKVRVYLATDASGATFKDLGGLKGSKGSQQYAVPAKTSLSRYDTVVFWCVPFSVSLASADLRPA